MKKWIAALANFFLPGLGYLIAGGPRRVFAAGWLVGVVGLTYVETSLQAVNAQLYWTMFASVFLMNTVFAIDAWRDARALEA